MILKLLDDATELQKQSQLLVSEVRALRKENELLKSKVERLELQLSKSDEDRVTFKHKLDLNTVTSGLEKKEDIKELRLKINQIIRELDRAIILFEQQGTDGK
jgi:hypothetical protein